MLQGGLTGSIRSHLAEYFLDNKRSFKGLYVQIYTHEIIYIYIFVYIFYIYIYICILQVIHIVSAFFVVIFSVCIYIYISILLYSNSYMFLSWNGFRQPTKMHEGS